MKLQNDMIQMEERKEVQDILLALDKYFKQNPAEKKNRTLKELYDKLDRLDMCW